MSWQREAGNKTPSRSLNPRKRELSATTYNSPLSGNPPFPNPNQINNRSTTPNYPQFRTLEECWGFPVPSIDQLNNIPEAFGHYL